MNIHFRRFQTLFCLLITCLFLSAAKGATYSVITKFTGPNGATPDATLFLAADGNFYGTTAYGGSSSQGTVFKVTSAGVLTTLASFNGTNGETPFASVIQGTGTDTNFYGTTHDGGSFGYGTVFKVTPAGVLTTLVNFNKTNGANPNGGLVEDSHANFYGTTEGGGSSSEGTVFKFTSTGSSTTFTTLVNFNGTNGSSPEARLIQGSDSYFYGTTFFGGSSSKGTVFKMTSAGVLTTLVNFNGPNGDGPQGAMVQDKYGTFYGTTGYSDSNGLGTNGVKIRSN